MTTVKRLRILFSKSFYLFLVVLLIVTACNQSSKNSSALSEQDKAAIKAIAEKDSALVMSRNWSELVSEYTIDAVRMPPNMPAIEGRDSIRKFLDGFPPIKKFNFHMTDMQGEGNLAYIRAAYSFTIMVSDSTEVSDTGKILVVLKKQSDGSWMRVADAWNSDLPPAK